MSAKHVLVEFNQITDFIYLGTNLCCTAIPHIQVLLNLGIDAEINLEKEKLEEIPDIDIYLWLPVDDHVAPTQDQLDLGVAVIDSLVKNRKKVYIHCKNGHGRSPTLLAAYFISQGMSVDEAIQKIKAKRPEIHLQEAQVEALNIYQP